MPSGRQEAADRLQDQSRMRGAVLYGSPTAGPGSHCPTTLVHPACAKHAPHLCASRPAEGPPSSRPHASPAAGPVLTALRRRSTPALCLACPAHASRRARPWGTSSGAKTQPQPLRPAQREPSTGAESLWGLAPWVSAPGAHTEPLLVIRAD